LPKNAPRVELKRRLSQPNFWVVRMVVHLLALLDRDWGVSPDVIAVDKVVPALDGISADTELRTNGGACITLLGGVGERALLGRASGRNADRSPLPDVVAVNKGVGILDLSSRETELASDGCASVTVLGRVCLYAARSGGSRR